VADVAGLDIHAVEWREVEEGDDLVALILASTRLLDGDVLVLSSKVVSKAEGARREGDRNDLVLEETARVVASRGDTVIAQTRHGLVLAAAGVDASNTPAGTALLLPRSPDASAAAIREGVCERTGRNVAVLLSDTAGRAWRTGQTDLCIGCAGLMPVDDHRGRRDRHGNELKVTAPAIADELASAADLVKGKTSGRPLAVVRGLRARVLPPGRHGPGATALLRGREADLFGLGSREAVVAAVTRRDPESLSHFPADDRDPFAALEPAEQPSGLRWTVDAARDGLWRLRIEVPEPAGPAEWLAAGRLLERAHVLAAAHRLQPATPSGEDAAGADASVAVRAAWRRAATT
jgi:coenzyme F420-0:L-glutamate ligase/coenzyme F420-1:gamma-L-glutamate ligase